MAAEQVGNGVRSVFIYTREAHPGEIYPAHRSMEQKLEHARIFRDTLGIRRPVLVDALDGSGHTLYGGLSNMAYIIGRGGTVLFKSDWSDVPLCSAAVDYYRSIRARRHEGTRLAPFHAEMQGYRVVDHQGWDEGLRRGGEQALDDFKRVAASRGARKPAEL